MKTTKSRVHKTSNALEIIDARLIRGNAAMEQLVEAERCKSAIGRQIYQLRTKAKLTQNQLAQRVGTTTSVICRLEDADYEGHSMTMLQRIARALEQRVEVRFVKAGR